MKEKTLILALCLLFAACNDDNSSTPASGQFIDSPVSGLAFDGPSIQGITTQTGTFSFADSETVQFSLGEIILGTALGARTLTPIDFSIAGNGVGFYIDSAGGLNIARFLQSIDNDGNPDNGIEITEIMRSLAADRSIDFFQSRDDFANDGNVQTIVADLTATRPIGPGALIDDDQSRDHLKGSLENIVAERYAELEVLVGDAPCSTVDQCDAIAVGANMCGGPDNFMPYSATETEFDELERVASSHRRHSLSFGYTAGYVGLCVLVSKPPLACENNRCVATD